MLHCCNRVCNRVSKAKKGNGSDICSMWLSSIADDGQCAIDIKVDPNGMQHDVSNDLEIRNAAGAVRRDCVGTRLPNTGGLVEQLGMYFILCLSTKRRRSSYIDWQIFCRRVAQQIDLVCESRCTIQIPLSWNESLFPKCRVSQ